MTAEQDGLDPAKVQAEHEHRHWCEGVWWSCGRCPTYRLAALALDLQGKVARVEAEARWLASGPTANIDTLTRAVAAARIRAALADPQEGTHADN